MRRREFIAVLLLSAATRRAAAQQRSTPRLALFHPAIPTNLLTETGGGTAWRAFFDELRRLAMSKAKVSLLNGILQKGTTSDMQTSRGKSSAAIPI
jgi:hypothetical protein